MKKYLLVYISFGVLMLFGLSSFIKVAKSSPVESKKIFYKVNPARQLGLYTKPVLDAFEDQQMTKPDKVSREQILKNISQLPLIFQKNMGQWQEEVLYRASSQVTKVGFRKNGVTFFSTREIDEHMEGNDKEDGELHESMTWNLNFKGMNGTTEIVAEGEQPGVTNYFLGNDSTKWVRNTPESRLINYKGIYDNIDLHYYGLENYKLEYDYIVKPQGKISDIAMELEGAGNLKINNKGELVITTPWGEVAESKPYSYQVIKGVKKEIDVRYQIIDEKTFGFKVYGKYNKNHDLVIDPKTLVWSFFSKGMGETHYVQDHALDAARNSYLTGWTDDLFITTAGVVQTTFGGGTTPYDAWVAKYNRWGTAMIYCTYLGGNQDERGLGIAVTAAGVAYVTGRTDSGNYPTTAGAAYPAQIGGTDTFISGLNTTGTAFIFSTYFGNGGADGGQAITLNAAGQIYVAGYGKKNSIAFPSTAGVVRTNAMADGTMDAYVVKMGSAGAIIFATLLGGSGTDEANGIFVSSSGEIYVSGDTDGSFPITGGVDATANGGLDAFVAKLDANATTIVYSTYLGGGSDDLGYGIFVLNDEAYVTGSAGAGFPTTAGAKQTAFSGGTMDAFAAKLNTAGNALVYSTYIGGTAVEGGPHNDWKGGDIAVNNNGQAYVTGISSSADFPITSTNGGYDVTYGGGGVDDGFVALLNATGTAFLCATFVGADKDDYKRMSIALDLTGTTDTVYGSITTHSAAFQIAQTQGAVYGPTKVNAGFDETGVIKMVSCVTTPLPVNIISFKGSNKGDYNLLEWATASEINNDYFTIERSSDGINFSVIGRVDGAGNSGSLLNYSYSDPKEDEEIAYYRLKQTDIDGKTTYYKIVMVNSGSNQSLSLTVSSPVTDYLNYSVYGLQKGNAKAEVTDMTGKVMLSANVQVNEGYNKLTLDAKNIAEGSYILTITSDNGTVSAKFVK